MKVTWLHVLSATKAVICLHSTRCFCIDNKIEHEEDSGLNASAANNLLARYLKILLKLRVQFERIFKYHECKSFKRNPIGIKRFTVLNRRKPCPE